MSKTIATGDTSAVAAEPQVHDTDSPTDGREEIFKMTVNIPLALHLRAAGITFHSQYAGEPAGYSSLTDLVRIGLDDLVTKIEHEHNNGNPYPAPRGGLRRGRR